MIIIGEKINGAVPKSGKAIMAHDTDYIAEIAKAQADVLDEDNDFLDCCSGVELDEEETLKWLIDTIQANTDMPIAIDSPDPDMCVKCMEYTNKPGIINSVSMQSGKIEAVFPTLGKSENEDWGIIALLSDDHGSPEEAEGRLDLLKQILEAADKYGIAHDRLFIDPLVETLGTSPESLLTFNECCRGIKEIDPSLHITSGLSNISFGLPVRKVINLSFMALAMQAGMDSCIIDPLARDLRGVIYATDALLGEDEYCGEYLSAYRDNIFGPVKQD
jgi:5-methyltetrahydrofolate corrinoid/iron sulfur protein methyltransferase